MAVSGLGSIGGSPGGFVGSGLGSFGGSPGGFIGSGLGSFGGSSAVLFGSLGGLTPGFGLAFSSLWAS